MLTNFPTVKVSSAPLAALDIDHERTKGAVAATHFPIATSVVIESQALLRIVKHANDFGSRTAAGKLTGMQFGTAIEVTLAVPEYQPPYDPNLTLDELAVRRREVELEERSNLERLGKAGFDGFVVGRYVSCAHSALSEFNVKMLAEAMSDVPSRRGAQNKEPAKEARPGLLLVYEPQKTSMGRLHIKAYVPTPEYAAYAATAGGTAEFVKSGMSASGVVREVPLTVHVSPLAELLFGQLAAAPRAVRNTVVADGSLGTFAERGIAQVAEFQREVRQASDYVRARERGGEQLKAELLFERIRTQAQYLANVEIECVANVDFVRVLKEEHAGKAPATAAAAAAAASATPVKK
jgi:hypothetical protein